MRAWADAARFPPVRRAHPSRRPQPGQRALPAAKTVSHAGHVCWLASRSITFASARRPCSPAARSQCACRSASARSRSGLATASQRFVPHELQCCGGGRTMSAWMPAPASSRCFSRSAEKAPSAITAGFSSSLIVDGACARRAHWAYRRGCPTCTRPTCWGPAGFPILGARATARTASDLIRTRTRPLAASLSSAAPRPLSAPRVLSAPRPLFAP